MIVNFSIGKYYGVDSLVEVLIIIVSLIIAYNSRKIYKLINDKSYKYFSYAFLAITLSFIFKILSNLTIVHRVRIVTANFVYTGLAQMQYIQLVKFLSYIAFKSFNILGFLLLFLVITKTEDKEKAFLFFYLGVISVLFSIYFDFVFHLTSIVILLFLVIHYYDNHKKVNNKNSKIVLIAFSIILLANLFFVFSEVHSLFYLIGEVLLLFGYMSLLINQIKIMRDGKGTSKKNLFINDKDND